VSYASSCVAWSQETDGPALCRLGPAADLKLFSAATGNGALHDLPRGFDVLYPALRDAGADVNLRNFAAQTPLHTAAAAADAPLVHRLLADGANARATASDASTPLHAVAGGRLSGRPHLGGRERAALAGDQLETARALVNAGADVWARNEAGRTALDVAKGVQASDALVVRPSSGYR
jgi:hypothetical protein